MPSVADKKAIYREARKKIGLTIHSWGRIFALGNTKDTYQNVSLKEKDVTPQPGSISKGVNMPEALAAEMLRIFHYLGFDVDKIEFDEKGRIAKIPHNIEDAEKLNQKLKCLAKGKRSW